MCLAVYMLYHKHPALCVSSPPWWKEKPSTLSTVVSPVVPNMARAASDLLKA